ncbi:fimbrial protein [Burkholderia sp. Tr-20390]|uniref:fimbrial protein n=1 Tax=Burkholderia sp. Tr-20390 TaxID=2703904 RepID=UPI00197FC19B|nr:fimbrial protein [Burkholderia sp. Tr-20390]MBN3734691.1 type 1 fimbrial protein [Burkholderia sp. Tr-20390]
MKFISRKSKNQILIMLITWLSPILLGGGLSHAQTCQYVPYNPSPFFDWTYNDGNILVPPRAPNGTVLASGIFEYGYSCQANPHGAGGWRIGFAVDYRLSNIPNVFIARSGGYWGSIGFRITNADSGEVMIGSGQEWQPPIKDTFPITGKLRIKIEVVKVNNELYNYLPVGAGLTGEYVFMMNIYNRTSGERTLTWRFFWKKNGTTIQTMQESCSVLTPSINVPLPATAASKLKTIGATAGDTHFNISLSCKSGSKVYVTLTDLTDQGNLTDQLTLTQDSSAQGVKLRILKDGNPVSYGPDSISSGNPNQWYVGPSATTTSIPLSAQYIATGPVSAGTVKGVATFTMSYQ